MILKIITTIGVLLTFIMSAFAYTGQDSDYKTHIHDFSCYSSWELNCEKMHEHFSWCYRGVGDRPLCGLLEGVQYSLEELEEHTTSTIAARVITCVIPEHQHDDNCLRVISAIKQCSREEISNIDSQCFVCSKDINSDDIEGLCLCVSDVHIHSTDCYEDVYLKRNESIT